MRKCTRVFECGDKIRMSKGKAKAMAGQMKVVGKPRDRSFKAYKFSYCGKWHVGHQSGKKPTR